MVMMMVIMMRVMEPNLHRTKYTSPALARLSNMWHLRG